jgi:DNA helicase-2/ATP-dependent DNA helicase PcrA
MNLALSDEQRECVDAPAGPLCIVAPAGSGKTAVLSHRIAHRVRNGDTHAPRVLAISFTRAASFQLKLRTEALLDGESITTGTFHAVALALLGRYWQRQQQRTPQIAKNPASLLLRIVQNAGNGYLGTEGGRRLQPRQVAAVAAGEITWMKARGITPSRYPSEARRLGRAIELDSGDIASLASAYDAHKRRSGLIDLDDLVPFAVEVMRNNAEFARGERLMTRHLYVDEFQDLNPSQYALLEALLQGNSDLTVVGDPNQAIYGWNGADPSLMYELTERFPDLRIAKLSTNYRSTPPIISAAQSVLIRRPDDPFEIKVRAARSEEGHRTPELLGHSDDHEEARAVLRSIREAHYGGLPYRKMAVLARTAATLTKCQAVLVEAGIPVHASGQTLHWLDGTGAEIVNVLRKEMADRPLAEGITALEAYAVVDVNQERSRGDQQAIEILRATMSRHLRAGVATVGACFDLMDEAEDDLSREGAVTLTTFHRAKGLEWHLVHVIGAEDGLVPHYRSVTNQQLEEERRLLYVALTRASDRLAVHSARRRTVGARTLDRQPSPLIRNLMTPPKNVAEPRGSDRPTRATLDDQEVLRLRATIRKELLRWRDDAARKVFTSPTSVAPDRLIHAIAESRPTSESELRSIDIEGRLRTRRWREAVLHICETGSYRPPVTH